MAKALLLSLFSILFLSFTVKAIGSDSNSTKIFIGDFNGDGYADYITKQTGDGANQTIELLLSRGNGKFNNCDLSEDFGSDLSDFNLYIGDFNGDGKDDILRQDKKGLLTTNTTLSVCLMISDGLGSFESHVLPDSFQLIGANLYIADFNGDGKADIFRQSKGFLTPESGSTSWASWVLFATGGPDFFRTLVLPLELELNGDKTNLYVGDFNGDGLDDILRQEKGSFAADGTNTANLLLFQLDESFEKIVLSEDYNLNGDLTVLHIGDFNGDGIDDILRREKSADYGSDMAQLMLSLDQGIFEVISLDENYNLGGDSGNVYIGDFNADGKTDLLRQDNNIQITEVFLSTGDSFDRFEFDKSQYNNDDQSNSIAIFNIGDFNGDGNDDILKSTNSDNKIYYSNGNGSFS